MQLKRKIDAMRIFLRCPWCAHRMKLLSSHLESRAPKAKLPWYGVSRSVLTCPQCKKPVRLSTRGQAWVLLAAPAFVLLPAATFIPDLVPKFSPMFWAICGAALVGICLARLFARLERADDTH